MAESTQSDPRDVYKPVEPQLRREDSTLAEKIKEFFYESHGFSTYWGAIYALITFAYFFFNIWGYAYLLKPYCLGQPVSSDKMFALSFAYVPDTFFAVGSGFAGIDVESS